jgi:transposase
MRLQWFGCGSLTAANLIAETAGVGPFRSRAAFAAYTGGSCATNWDFHSGRSGLGHLGRLRQLAAV